MSIYLIEKEPISYVSPSADRGFPFPQPSGIFPMDKFPGYFISSAFQAWSILSKE
jgi:hypothetical protein